MIIKQYQKPFVPKYANYDYTKVYAKKYKEQLKAGDKE